MAKLSHCMDYDPKVAKAVKNGFFGTMFGEQYKPGVTIIKIDPGEIDVWSNGAMCFVWGYPGPDYNLYKAEDYGKTWALTKKELRLGGGQTWNK